MSLWRDKKTGEDKPPYDYTEEVIRIADAIVKGHRDEIIESEEMAPEETDMEQVERMVDHLEYLDGMIRRLARALAERRDDITTPLADQYLDWHEKHHFDI